MNLKKKFLTAAGAAGLALALTMAPAASAQSSRNMAMHSQMAPVDINTASIGQLKALPGIGDVYAKRIVASRPYSSKGQLVSKGVLPQGVYEKIKDQVVAHRRK